MRIVIRNAVLLFDFQEFTQLATADVTGDWTFAVSLGDAGSGNAEITMAQEAEGKYQEATLDNWQTTNCRNL